MSRESLNPLEWTFGHGKRKGTPMILVIGECWIWQGPICHGYGVMSFNRRTHPGVTVGRVQQSRSGWSAIQTHQYFYVLKYGNPLKNTELGHTCSRRSCCNPDHVRPITKLQNAREMYLMPKLPPEEWEWVEEMLLDDKPCGWIANELNVSVWSIRQVMQQMQWHDQHDLFDDPLVPF